MAVSEFSDEGFVQDYDLGRQQELFIYCRICRSTFPVVFKPRDPSVRLRCLCGREGPLAELDVFRTEREAREHAAFYEKVYRAAKDALREAGLPLPPSGKYRRIEDVEEDSQFESYYDPAGDESDVADAYVEQEESDASPAGARGRLAEFAARLADAEQPIERHDVLTELLEWAYCRRQLDPRARERFRAACREDMELAPAVIRAAKERLRAGGKLRLSFSSFKHLAIDLEEEDDLEGALSVVERAAELGLKGYAERAKRLRRQLRRRS